MSDKLLTEFHDNVNYWFTEEGMKMSDHAAFEAKIERLTRENEKLNREIQWLRTQVEMLEEPERDFKAQLIEKLKDKIEDIKYW